MPKLDGPIGSQILDEGMTPAQWIEILVSRECVISERTLREKANEKGAFYRLGRAMLITPQQIDIIFEEGQLCRSESIRGAGITTSTGRSNTTAGRSPAHTGEALRHLQKRARGTG